MAQYATDFSEHTTAQQPSGWTERYNTDWDWIVREDAGLMGGKYLERTTDGTDKHSGLSWDEIDSDANRDNVETLKRVRFVSSNPGINSMLRGSGSIGSETYYRFGLNVQLDRLWIRATTNGSTATVTDQFESLSTGTWYWVRSRVNGTTVQIKYWTGAVGDEPVSWILDTTSSSISGTGWVGLVSFRRHPVDIDFFSVGTNGDPAPSELIANDFEITSPLDQATGVPDPFDFDLSNPNAVPGFYKQISKNAPDVNDDLSNLVKDIVATNISTSISGLDPLITHYLKGIELTAIGGQSSTVVFSDNYNRADDPAGWGSDYTSQVNSGTASNFIETNTGVIEADPSSRLLVDVLAPSVQDFDATWEFENQNVGQAYQPTLHFRSQGTWNASGRKHSYWVWLHGNEINLGRTSASYVNEVFDTQPFTRTANTKYKVRVLVEGFRIRVAIWAASGSQDGWIIDYTDTSEASAEGQHAIVVATTSGSTAGERMTFTLLEYAIAAEAPQITNIDTDADSATITYNTIPFDNEGYEYRYRTVGGTFGSWVNITYTNPFIISTLAAGDYEVQMSAMHDGQRSTLSDIKPFSIVAPAVNGVTVTPTNPELSEETGSTVQLTADVDAVGGASEAVTWSKQSGVAGISVDQTGLVSHDGTVVANDTAVIRATSDFDTDQWDEVTVTVTEALDLNITDSNQADRETLALFYQTTGADWETEKQHFDADNNDFYLHTGNATGWSTNAANINLDPAGTLPFGVEVEEINGEWRVVSLKLNSDSDVGWKEQHRQSNNGTKGGNNITGTIGTDFNWQLFRCKYINLKHNYINLSIPRKIFTPHLNVLHLNGTYVDMVPEISPSISNKEDWTQRSNRPEGNLPVEVGNATSLEIIVGRGRHWGIGDEETTGSNDNHIDQYAYGGDMPNTIINAPIKLCDFLVHRFTDFPDDMNQALEWAFVAGSVYKNDGSGHRTMRGLGTSRLAFLENKPNLRRKAVGRLSLGNDSADKSYFPDLSESQNIQQISYGFNGMEDVVIPQWVVEPYDEETDTGIKGLVGGGISEFVMEFQGIQGPLPSNGLGYGFSHRLCRSQLRIAGCGAGGEIPPEWIDPAIIQLDISGNQFTNNMDSLSSGWTSLNRIRNMYLQNNNFSGGLPILDWYSHTRQSTDHGLDGFSRIRVNNSGLNLSLNQPKKPWEIEQKQRRWYYDNKNNIISNVSGSYTLGDAQSDGYSSSFITNTLGTSSWNNSDPVKGSGRFMNIILDKIYSGWIVKDF